MLFLLYAALEFESQIPAVLSAGQIWQRITIPPDGRFEYEAGLAIATISVDMQTALSSATSFNYANVGPMTGLLLLL